MINIQKSDLSRYTTPISFDKYPTKKNTNQVVLYPPTFALSTHKWLRCWWTAVLKLVAASAGGWQRGTGGADNDGGRWSSLGNGLVLFGHPIIEGWGYLINFQVWIHVVTWIR